MALWRGGSVVARRAERVAVMQSARLMPMAQEVLAEAGLHYRDLGAVVSSVGPGSFTGIRVALSAARGIGLAAGLPVFGYSTLALMAYGISGRCVVALNAGKGECYWQAFENGAAVGEPCVGPLEDARAGGGRIITNLSPLPESCEAGAPDADALCALAASGARPLPPVPLYIRPPDAKPMEG